MIKIFRLFALTLLLLTSLTSVAEDAPHLYGCYFLQTREPGEWVTSTAALLIEPVPNGIHLHGSVGGWHNSWISTPDDQSPVLLTKTADKFVYQGEVKPDTPYARCELTLHYDKEKIYVKKYQQGCRDAWYTGNGIGPSEMRFADKQPNADMCLAYLGIVKEDKEEVIDKAKSELPSNK